MNLYFSIIYGFGYSSAPDEVYALVRLDFDHPECLEHSHPLRVVPWILLARI